MWCCYDEPRSRQHLIEELLANEPGFYKARAAIRAKVEKFRNETEQEREAGCKKYIEAQGLLDALNEDTVFISARWLLEQERGYVLPKRGELPPEALVSPEELRRIWEGSPAFYADKYFPIIAVSHCWRTKAHPDPEGVTTRMLQGQLEARWHEFTTRRRFSDVGVFFDWCSLWQSPRTPEQQESFKRALPAINLWYVHRSTFAWLVADARVPHPDGRAKGWTTLAGMIKYNSRRQVIELGGVLGITSVTPKPLAEPMSFYDGHRHGNQVYTNGADRKVVASLFETASNDIFRGVKVLNYSGQLWDEVRAARLGLVLPLCVSLRELQIYGSRLTARGLQAILEDVTDERALPKLEKLDVSRNRALGDDGWRLLGAALKEGALENLRQLYLIECNLTATGLGAILEAAVECRALLKLEYLDMSENGTLGDDGWFALGGALKEGALENLRRLYFKRCNLTATRLGAILEAAVKCKALSKLEYLDISLNRTLNVDGALALGAAFKPGVLENLQTLELGSCSMTATGVRALLAPLVNDGALPKLRGLHLRGNFGLDENENSGLITALRRRRCHVYKPF